VIQNGQAKKKAACAAFFCGDAQRLTRELAELLFELVDTTCGVNHFLFACVERMALGAHFNVEAFFAHGRFGHKSVAARAGHFQIGVFRMDTGFHDFPLGFRV